MKSVEIISTFYKAQNVDKRSHAMCVGSTKKRKKSENFMDYYKRIEIVYKSLNQRKYLILINLREKFSLF